MSTVEEYVHKNQAEITELEQKVDNWMKQHKQTNSYPLITEITPDVVEYREQPAPFHFALVKRVAENLGIEKWNEESNDTLRLKNPYSF